MIKFKLIGAVLVVVRDAIDAGAGASFGAGRGCGAGSELSIYSSGPPSYGYSGAMAQTLPDEAWAPQVPVRMHRAHHSMKHR